MTSADPSSGRPSLLLGVISDTHGRLPVEVRDAFSNVDRILHAGDIGGPGILQELRTIAPVTAVLGNNDLNVFGSSLPRSTELLLEGVRIRMAHMLRDVRSGLPEDTRVAIFGHTHQPLMKREGEVLLLNPGSPTRSRSGSGHNVALLRLSSGRVSARLVSL